MKKVRAVRLPLVQIQTIQTIKKMMQQISFSAVMRMEAKMAQMVR